MKTSLKTILATATVLSSAWAVPALGQDAEEDAPVAGNEIIVTATRIEQRLQDVPISITVLDESKITNNNIQSAKDIATYTPGLTTNNRYGSDNTTWTIRGFTQEQRTTSTVGTYFADVVAPRGSGATQGGDGAGPGALFDLANIQVLKGPQGTLFGRNSTGGAVLLVPRKPTDRFEGYVEGQVGDYDLRRVQAVVNVPVMDSLRIRLGVDRNKRDGYLKNAGKIGFGPHGDAGGSVDYWAARFSMVADLSPDVEHYVVASYSKSKSTGVNPKVTRCFPTSPYTNTATGFGALSCAQIAREAPLGFWSVSNTLPDQRSDTEQWQVINTTTIQVNDNLKIKNIFSYAEFRGDTNLDLFGFYRPIVTPGTETSGLQVQPFNTTNALPGSHTNAQSSLVEELQIQGTGMDGRFTWQGGLYYESNQPLGRSGIISTTFTPCSDVPSFNCVPLTNGANSLGRLAYQWHKNTFTGKAVYFQSSYDITEQLKITGGIRYTSDKMESDFALVNVRITAIPALGNYIFCNNTVTFGAEGSAGNPRQPLANRFGACHESKDKKSKAPTWLLGLDFKPTDDMLFYAKWSRGYRQGAVAPFAADLLQTYDKETVDTYEIGSKVSWQGAMPGWFNVAGFYNDFTDQQLQIGLSCNPVALCAQTTAIFNAGASTLKGIEADLGIQPFEGLRLEAAYAYLDTKIKKIVNVAPLVTALGLPFNDVRGLPVGAAIPNSMPHKLTLSGSYTLPLPDSIGKLSVGGTWVYSSKYRAVSDPTAVVGGNLVYLSKYGVLPSSKLLNLNVTWEDVGGLPVDAAFFATNVTKEKVLLHANVQASQGFVSNIIGEPRMYGVRLRYKFGN